MTDPETLLITEYYQRRLADWDDLELASLSDERLEQEAAEASCLRKLLTDYREENLDQMIGWIVGRTDAERRLDVFLNRAMARLGPPGVRERFYLFSETTVMPAVQEQAFAGGARRPLADYIHLLEDTIDDPAAAEDRLVGTGARDQWRAKTAVLMDEMVRYLLWLVRRLQANPQLQPVLLLRDTLVVYLGLRWLRQQGWAVPEPKALVFNRAFANAFAPPESIYETLLVDGLCHVVYEARARNLTALREGFARRVHGELSVPEFFVNASRRRLDKLGLDGEPLFVESGVNGTFPNWLLSLGSGGGEMVLYSTAPWLYEIYESVVFRRNYNYLREMETIIAHEHLFQVTIDDKADECWVRQTTDPVARQLALYELAVFRRLLTERVSPPGAPDQAASRLPEPCR